MLKTAYDGALFLSCHRPPDRVPAVRPEGPPRRGFRRMRRPLATGPRAPPRSDDPGHRVRSPPQPGPGLGLQAGLWPLGVATGAARSTNRAGTVHPCPRRWARYNQRHSRGPSLRDPPEHRSRLIPVPASVRSLLQSPSGPRRFPPPWAAISLTFALRSRTPVGGLLLTPSRRTPPGRPGARGYCACRVHSHAPRQPGASPPVSTRLSTKVPGRALLLAPSTPCFAPVALGSRAGAQPSRPLRGPASRAPAAAGTRALRTQPRGAAGCMLPPWPVTGT